MISMCFALQKPNGTESLQSAAVAAGRPVVAPGAAAVCFAGQQLTEVPDGLWDAAACLTHLDLSNNLLSCGFAGGLSGCAQLKVRCLHFPGEMPG